MKKKIPTIISIILILLSTLTSCSDRGNKTIDELDSLADHEPLTVLKRIDHENSISLSKYEKMRLSLIKYKAEDKLFVLHKSDSTINRLNDYFQKYGSLNDKLQSLYYMGGTYRDMGDYPSSMIMYERAIELAESNTLGNRDSLALANINSQSAEILYRIGDYKEALKYATISYELRKDLGIANISTFEDIGRLSESAGDIAQAREFYQKAIMSIIDNNEECAYIDYLGEQLGFFINNKMMDHAEFIYRIIAKDTTAQKPANVYAAIASYFTVRHHTDSALQYAMKAYKLEKRLGNKAELAQNIAFMAKTRGNNKIALEYAIFAMDYYRAAQKAMNAEEVSKAKMRRSLEEIRKARTVERESQQTRNMYYMTGVIFALVVILSILIMRHFVNIRRIKLLTEMKQIKEEKEELKSEHTSLQNKILADKKLRAETAPDVASVIKFLMSMSDSSKEKLQPDMWGTVFDAVDKLHPNLRQQLLNYNEDLENKDLILLYLMKLEFKQADIARIMKRAPSVISRKFHRIEEMLGVPTKEALRDKLLRDRLEGDKANIKPED